MGQGALNPFVDDRTELLASGVPLIKSHEEAKGSRVRRPDVARRNHQFYEWFRAHPDASDDAKKAEIRATSQRLAGMSGEERAAALQGFAEDGNLEQVKHLRWEG
jgi:hypothetical protein